MISARAVDHAPIQPPPESRDPLRETGNEAEHLLGDWAGQRSRLVQRGVHLQLGYVGEVIANLSGGKRTGAVYEGIAEVALGLDLERITHGGWRDAYFHICGLWAHGASPSSRLTGDALAASNIDAYDSLRLYELWLEQNFADGKLSLRAGSLLADTEFAGTDFGGTLLNGAFGWPTFISGNTLNTGPAFPVSALGVRARWMPHDQWYAQAGVYDGDNFDSPTGDRRINAHGTHWKFNPQQGAFIIGETAFRLNQGSGDRGLPGTYKLGAWWHTADFADQRHDASGGSFIVSGLPPKTHRENFGAYFTAEQQLWREGAASPTAQGLGVFGRFGAGPRDRSAFEFVAEGGLHYTGLLPGRDADKLALGVIYAQVSRDVRSSQSDDAAFNGTAYPAFADHELVCEATYRCVVKPWWTIQPDLQFIHHPGGSAAIRDAWVVGLRTNITF